jgi:hypothetical protein
VSGLELTSGQESQAASEAPIPLVVHESGPSRWERRAAARWRAVPRRRRRWLLLSAAGTLLAVLAGTLTWNATRPRPQPPAPWPGQVVAASYLGTYGSLAPEGPRFALLLQLTDRDTRPVTVKDVTQPYPGMTFSLIPGLPVTLRPGVAQVLRIHPKVDDCSRVPTEDVLPFIDVTFRNTRAIQTVSEIPGDRYAHDLHRALTTLCPPGHPR